MLVSGSWTMAILRADGSTMMQPQEIMREGEGAHLMRNSVGGMVLLERVTPWRAIWCSMAVWLLVVVVVVVAILFVSDSLVSVVLVGCVGDVLGMLVYWCFMGFVGHSGSVGDIAR